MILYGTSSQYFAQYWPYFRRHRMSSRIDRLTSNCEPIHIQKQFIGQLKGNAIKC